MLAYHFHHDPRYRRSGLVRALHCQIRGREGTLQTRLVPLGRSALPTLSCSVDGPGTAAQKVRPPQLAASFISNAQRR